MLHVKSSILDFPHPGLSPEIWDKDGKLQSQHKEVILTTLTQLLEEAGLSHSDEWIDEISIIGSITTYQYVSTSDIDLHIFTDLDKFIKLERPTFDQKEAAAYLDNLRGLWNETMGPLPGTRHQLETYFDTPFATNPANRVTGIYNISTDTWEKPPVAVNIDFDIEEMKPFLVDMANALAEDFDVSLGDIKRHVERIEELQEVMAAWPEDKRQLFQTKIDERIVAIDTEISDLVALREKVVQDRKNYKPESQQEINFKYLQRFGYLFLVGQFKDLLQQVKNITEDTIPNVKDIVSEASLSKKANQEAYWIDPEGTSHQVASTHEQWANAAALELKRDRGITVNQRDPVRSLLEAGWVRVLIDNDDGAMLFSVASLATEPRTINDFVLEHWNRGLNGILIEDLKGKFRHMPPPDDMVRQRRGSINLEAGYDNYWIKSDGTVMPIKDNDHNEWARANVEWLEGKAPPTANGVSSQMFKMGWTRAIVTPEAIYIQNELNGIPEYIDVFIWDHWQDKPGFSVIYNNPKIGGDKQVVDVSEGLEKGLRKTRPISSAQKEEFPGTGTLMIDFDSTLVKNEKVIDGAKEALEQFKKDGWEIVIYSCRAHEKSGVADLKELLKKYDLPYDDIFIGKPFAQYYIDDRAVPFTTWTETAKKVTKTARLVSAFLPHAYWIAPDGQVFQVRGDSDSYATHSGWITDNHKILEGYGISIPERPELQDETVRKVQRVDDTMNAMYEDGWVRIGDSTYDRWGITVQDIHNVPTFVDNVLAQFVPPGQEIDIADKSGTQYVTVEYPFDQKDINRALMNPASTVAKQAQKGADYDYSSTHVCLPKHVASQIIDWGKKNIPDHHIYSDETGRYGREKDSHVTVKYGLLTNDAEAVKKLFAQHKPVKVKFGKTRFFSPPTGLHDVVVIDVSSKDLEELNKAVEAAFEAEDLYPTYEPHATIAYVMPGHGKKYQGQDVLGETELILNEVIFAPKDGEDVVCPLGGCEKEADFSPSIATSPADNDWQFNEGGPDVEIATKPQDISDEETYYQPPVDKPRPKSFWERFVALVSGGASKISIYQLSRFFKEAPKEDQIEVQSLLNTGRHNEASVLVEKIVGKEADGEAAEVLKLIQETGGATYNLKAGNLAGQPLYSVATYPDRGVILDHPPTLGELYNYIDQNRDVLNADASLGAWISGNQTYLDIVSTLSDRNEAIDLGKQHNQIAIFDLKTFQEIPTGGTGEVITTAGPVGNNYAPAWKDEEDEPFTPLPVTVDMKTNDKNLGQPGVRRFMGKPDGEWHSNEGDVDDVLIKNVEKEDKEEKKASTSVLRVEPYGGGVEFPVLVNPTAQQVLNMIKKLKIGPDDGLRVIQGDNMYVWEARQATHDHVLDFLAAQGLEELSNTQTGYIFGKSDVGEFFKRYASIPLSIRDKKAKLDKKSDYKGYWIAPDGKEFMVGTGHQDWMFVNTHILESYGIDPSSFEYTDDLIHEGWVRAAIDHNKQEGIVLTVENLRNIPRSVDDFLSRHFSGRSIALEDRHEELVEVEDPFPSIQKAVNKALKLIKKAYSSIGTNKYWITPREKIIQIGTSEMHIDWAIHHLNEVAKSGIDISDLNEPIAFYKGIYFDDLDEGEQQTFEGIMNDMQLNGWVRISTDDTKTQFTLDGGKFGFGPGTDQFIAEHFDPNSGKPIGVSWKGGEYLEIYDPFPTIAKAYQRAVKNPGKLAKQATSGDYDDNGYKFWIDPKGKVYDTINEGEMIWDHQAFVSDNRDFLKEQYHSKADSWGDLIDEGWTRVIVSESGDDVMLQVRSSGSLPSFLNKFVKDYSGQPHPRVFIDAPEGSYTIEQFMGNLKPSKKTASLSTWSGPAFRVDTGYTHDSTVTALDVVKYETQELGNDLGVDTTELDKILAKTPARNLIWVTHSLKEAMRYGSKNEVQKFNLPVGSLIVGQDGDGGYLVLLNPAEKTAGNESTTYTDEQMEKIYDDQHAEDGLGDTPGGGNVYHDWNQDTSQFPKVPGPYKVRLDILQKPVDRRFPFQDTPPYDVPFYEGMPADDDGSM